MKRKNKIIIIITGIIVLVLCSLVFFMSNKKTTTNHNDNHQNTNSSVIKKNDNISINNDKSTNKNTRNTNKKDNKKKDENKNKNNDMMTKEGAVKASQELLRDINNSPNNKSDKERLKMLSKSQNSYDEVLSKQARDKIRLVDFMNTDKRGGILTAQSLIEVVQGLKAEGNKQLTATKVQNYNSIVYLDKDTKTAVVPVDLYSKTPTNLNLTFAYIDGHWKFQPYNLISEINIRQTDKSQITAQNK